jgi:hypothetical protein
MSNAARNLLIVGGLGALGYWWYASEKEASAATPVQRQGGGAAPPVSPVKKPPIVGPGPVGPVGPDLVDLGVPGVPPVEDLGPPTGAEGYAAGKIDAALTMSDYELGGDGSPVFVRSDNWQAGWPGTDAEKGYRDGFVEAVVSMGYVLEGDPVGADAMLSRPMSAGGPPGGAASETSQVLAEQGGTEDAFASIATVEAEGGPMPAVHYRWNEAWNGTVSGEVYKTSFMQTLSIHGYGFDGTNVYLGVTPPSSESFGGGDTGATADAAGEALVSSYEHLFDFYG